MDLKKFRALMILQAKESRSAPFMTILRWLLPVQLY